MKYKYFFQKFVKNKKKDLEISKIRKFGTEGWPSKIPMELKIITRT